MTGITRVDKGLLAMTMDVLDDCIWMTKDD